MTFTRQQILTICISLASLAVALLVLEMGLRLMTPFPISLTSNRIDHPKLGYTLDPKFRDIDQHGFRNIEVTLEEADLAIIGDSQTYGINVSTKNNFPSIIASMTGRKVYNFGVSSYGIYQHKILLDLATQFNFRDVVLALYPANDISNSCKVTTSDYWKDYATSVGLTLPDCSETDTTGKKTARKASLSAFIDKVLKTLRYTATVDALKTLIWDRITVDKVNTQAFFLVGENQAVLKERVNKHATEASFDSLLGKINLENSKKFLKEAQDKLKRSSIRFVVVLIPSKERVLLEWAKRSVQVHDPEFAILIANEIALTAKYKEFFDRQAITYVDALPYVLEVFTHEVAAGRA